MAIDGIQHDTQACRCKVYNNSRGRITSFITAPQYSRVSASAIRSSRRLSWVLLTSSARSEDYTLWRRLVFIFDDHNPRSHIL
jgi:hypothetical protein